LPVKQDLHLAPDCNEKKYYFCTVEQSRMSHDRTYRPVRRVPAPRLRDADGSMRQAPRRSAGHAGHAATHPVQPLKGLPGTRATDVPYRALAPGGAGTGRRVCAGTSESRLTANYSLLTANSSYTFSAKERDPETGLSYFGSRYYSSDLSIWLSVDPMSDKYASLSPYTYCADNPVKLVDPNGEEIWKPEITGTGDIRLLAEDGDKISTLYEFLGGEDGLFSKRKVQKMWNKRDSQNNVVLPKNNFSNAIKRAKKEGLPEESNFSNCSESDLIAMGYRKNYNCFGAALSGADGDPIGYYSSTDLDGELKYGNWYSTDTPIFGKTLIRFAKGKKAVHAAVFFGKDHSGNSYVFTKNGFYYAPTIMNLKDVETIPEYGPVTPLITNTERLQGDSGMYNYGKPRKPVPYR